MEEGSVKAGEEKRKYRGRCWRGLDRGRTAGAGTGRSPQMLQESLRCGRSLVITFGEAETPPAPRNMEGSRSKRGKEQNTLGLTV